MKKTTPRNIIQCILIAGVFTAVADGMFGIAQTVIAEVPSPVPRFFQGIASVLIGRRPLHGGTPAFALGVVMHFAVAFFWSALFALLLVRSRLVRDTLASRWGVFKVAVAYGPVVWTVMSFVVISTLVHHLPTVGSDWWIEFAGHILSAGLPIALVFRFASSRKHAHYMNGEQQLIGQPGRAT